MKDAVSFIKQYDYNGKLVRDIQLPGIGTAGGFGGKEKETTCIFRLPIM
jgi:prolyl oligopeptidase